MCFGVVSAIFPYTNIQYIQAYSTIENCIENVFIYTTHRYKER